MGVHLHTVMLKKKPLLRRERWQSNNNVDREFHFHWCLTVFRPICAHWLIFWMVARGGGTLEILSWRSGVAHIKLSFYLKFHSNMSLKLSQGWTCSKSVKNNWCLGGEYWPISKSVFSTFRTSRKNEKITPNSTLYLWTGLTRIDCALKISKLKFKNEGELRSLTSVIGLVPIHVLNSKLTYFFLRDKSSLTIKNWL